MAMYPTTTRGQCTPYTTEIVRFVKQNIQEPEPEPYVCKKIWMRSDKHSVAERTDLLWRIHFYRRQENLLKGYFSVPWESFRPMGGEIVLDTGELVTQTLSKFLKNKEFMRHSLHHNEKTDFLPPVEEPIVKKSISSGGLQGKKFSRAGYQDILDMIHVTKDRICAVRARVPFEEHVRYIESLSKNNDDHQENGMLLMSLTDLYLMVMSSTVKETDPDADHTDYSDVQTLSPTSPRPLATSSPIERPLTAGSTDIPIVDGDDSVVTSATNCISDCKNSVLHVNSGLNERKERIRKDHIDYLNCIYSVIMSIRRMQTRDLRSKTPLSREYLRELLKVPTGTDKDSRLTQVRFSRNYNHRMSMDTSLSGDTSSLSQEGGRLSVFGVPTARRRSRAGSVFGHLPSVSSRRKSRMWERDYQRVETWEDLLTLDDKASSEASSAAMTQNIILKTLKWSRRTSCVPGESVEEREAKKIPVWQQIATEKPTSMFNEIRKQNSPENPALVVEKMRHNMNKLKYNLQKQADAELQRLERTRMLMYKYKMQCFEDLAPNSLFQTLCEQMKDTTHLIEGNSDIEVQPSMWYENLKERTHSKIASDDLEINEILSKIGKFSQMGPKTVNYSKAKMCLLVMSLPAYEICRISMQAAIKFVLGKILLLQDEHLQHWLGLRKLPIVLVK